ncbi:hypothetical protein [Sphingomonas fennica]|uniref:hypothetical protein n=1 Tax=Edaphosphingomonas fennica TaxID=114404 RepID=UPI001FEB171D|nr:hypothetical protein [Sphingomonas fennica]
MIAWSGMLILKGRTDPLPVWARNPAGMRPTAPAAAEEMRNRRRVVDRSDTDAVGITILLCGKAVGDAASSGSPKEAPVMDCHVLPAAMSTLVEMEKRIEIR